MQIKNEEAHEPVAKDDIKDPSTFHVERNDVLERVDSCVHGLLSARLRTSRMVWKGIE